MRRSRAQACAQNATIPLIPLSPKSAIIPALRCSVPRCGTLAVSFLPQLLRFAAHFWADAPSPPNRRHAAAIWPPQMWTAVKPPRHEALARIELESSLGDAVAQVRARSGVPHVLGVRSFRSSLKKVASVDLARAAGKRGLDRPGQADRGGGSRGGAAGRHRGADPRGHAGDRDFEPALYRERRALHDRDA